MPNVIKPCQHTKREVKLKLYEQNANLRKTETIEVCFAEFSFLLTL